MAELIPAPFSDLVTRLFTEPQLQDTLFELPRKKWYTPPAGGPDLAVRFHGRQAGHPLGPAAGPHTQMAQNILLSYIAGARILELKTVQIEDRLEIPRPCIDMTNVGYNVEWSQELLTAESLREYAAGVMLVEMYRRVCDYTDGRFADAAGAVLYDISVGYDLEGIRSDKLGRFLDGMRHAEALVERLRDQVPRRFTAARELPFPTRLSDSVTLSTFHGCPAGEIERICEYLIGEHDFDVVVKMNPPMLGEERLEHLLHEVLGYEQLGVNPGAYTSGLTFAEGVQICERLTRFARVRGRQLGFKFSNTLEVLNHRDFFAQDNKVMYLSGQPLHPIVMTLVDEFRRSVGSHVPISFSAGIDQFNFPAAVACGFVPITVSTDLLRPGGYGRLPAYLRRLVDDMRERQAANIAEYIFKRFGQEDEARRAEDEADGPPPEAAVVRWAGLLNTTVAATQAREDPRYRADHNHKVPKRLDSHLTTFDCITCDKCLPVCPNAANFVYPTPTVSFDYQNVIVTPGGERRAGSAGHFTIDQERQIACYADFCNECGNCDTFCPELGGPYIKKPTFYGTLDSWHGAAPRDGFHVWQDDGRMFIWARMGGRVFQLASDQHDGCCVFIDGVAQVGLSADHEITRFEFRKPVADDHEIDMGVFHTLRALLHGVLDRSCVNEVNAAFCSK